MSKHRDELVLPFAFVRIAMEDYTYAHKLYKHGMPYIFYKFLLSFARHEVYSREHFSTQIRNNQ